MAQYVTQILPSSPDAIRVAGERIREGLLVAMPTETVYGLAGDALNEEAVLEIFRTKERPRFDPLIVHVPGGAEESSVRQASLDTAASLGLIEPERLSPECRETAHILMSRFWPGPLTLVLPKGPKVPDLVTSGLPTVALRMPAHPVAQELLRVSGRPLAAPSANRFGRISPTSARAVEQELGGRIGWILDGGPCSVGIESTVVKVEEDGSAVLLRPGGARVEEIESALKAIGKELLRPSAVGSYGAAQLSPGRLLSHYAPEKRLTLLAAPAARVSDSELRESAGGAPVVGVLLFKKEASGQEERLRGIFGDSVRIHYLSANGDSAEAARSLFATLRVMDASDANSLIAELCPDSDGLAQAINDRLRRAAHR